MSNRTFSNGEGLNKFTNVQYTIDGNVTAEGEIVKFKYTEPSNENEKIRSESSNNRKNIPMTETIITITVNVPPSLTSAVIETTDNDRIINTFNEDIKDNVIVEKGDYSGEYNACWWFCWCSCNR